MRTFGVVLSLIIAGPLSGAAGYYIANRGCVEEIARLTQERDHGFVRERELRGQFEAALAERAAFAQEAQRLQEDLSERLKRLETIADQLAPEGNRHQEHREE